MVNLCEYRGMGTNNIDTTVAGWKNAAIIANLDSIKSGVYTALIGSGWRTDADSVADRTQAVALYLIEKSLDKWAGYQGKNKNMLSGFCRWIAYQRTVNYIKLHRHMYDGSASAMRIDTTDATQDDKAPRVVIDDTSALAFVRIEQRERLVLALDTLDAMERSHMDTLFAGGTSAAWAAEHGLTPVQANRHKAATIAKLAALVQE